MNPKKLKQLKKRDKRAQQAVHQAPYISELMRDRDLFDLVHKLAAAVVALARVPLGVLVRHHTTLSRKH